MNNDIIKKYIENNIDLIEHDDWEKFFKEGPADTYAQRSRIYPSGIGGLLYDADIPFLDKLSYIPSRVFVDCNNLINFNIPYGITDIKHNAFSGCENLSTIKIPNSVKSIGEYAFSRCTSLTRITIPDSVASIDNDAFYNCKNINSVIMPNLKFIGESIFFECPNLKDIYFKGTKSDWKRLYRPIDFINLYFTVHCSDGDIIKRKR